MSMSLKLLESNIEKAEIVLAVKGEMVDKLQRQAELISNMKVDVLGPLVERIKAERGIEIANGISTVISSQLDIAVNTIMSVKDAISNETLKLSGDIADEPDIGDLSTTDDIESFEIDIEDEDFEEEGEGSEPVPTEREMKESVRSKSVKVIFEGIDGEKTSKSFTNLAMLKQYVNENKDDIKSLKVIKD